VVIDKGDGAVPTVIDIIAVEGTASITGKAGGVDGIRARAGIAIIADSGLYRAVAPNIAIGCRGGRFVKQVLLCFCGYRQHRAERIGASRGAVIKGGVVAPGFGGGLASPKYLVRWTKYNQKRPRQWRVWSRIVKRLSVTI